MKEHFYLFLFLLAASISPVSAQKYSNEFLAIGVGGRAHGMSGAQTAITDDITAAYWNPAGLTQIKAPLQLAAMHAEWFAGVGQYDYLAFGKSLNRDRRSFLALSLIRLGIDQIPYTINLVEPDGTINYDNLSEFSAADYALMGSFARQLRNPAFSVGGSVKVVRRVIGTIGSSWGFGTDAGVQYRKGNLMLGLTAHDLTTTFNAWSFSLSEREKEVFTATGNEIPVSNTEITRPRFSLGAAYKIKAGAKTTLLPALDLDLTTDGQRNVLLSSSGFNLDPRFGLEADYDGFVQLRAGVANFQRVKDDFNPDKEILTLQPNFGIGLRLGRVQLDYALTDIGNVSQVQYSHIFSVRLDFRERRQD
ncbi:MAG TPA: PorV/PorQ family protein [Saprospiraceae bacterium]|nr:PorV/PorQ family protein [Saprospiraceae bacterium]